MRILKKFSLWVPFLFLPIAPLLAQEAPPDTSQSDTPPKETRVVEHRPTGYSLKRAMHPFSWFDVGVFRPVYRLGTGPLRERFRGPTGPVKIGVGGMGAGSGFGPVVTPI